MTCSTEACSKTLLYYYIVVVCCKNHVYVPYYILPNLYTLSVNLKTYAVMWQICCSKLKWNADWVILILQGHHCHVDRKMILKTVSFMNMLVILSLFMVKPAEVVNIEFIKPKHARKTII